MPVLPGKEALVLYLVTTPDAALGHVLRGRHVYVHADLTALDFDFALRLSRTADVLEERRVAILHDEVEHPLVREFCALAESLGLPDPEVVEHPSLTNCHVLALHKEGKELGVYYLTPDPLPTNGGATTNGGAIPSATNGSVRGALW